MQPGDPAPAVSLALHNGETVAISDLWRERVVVLFFYPKDNTSICTKEACAFRDAYEEFVAAGATVVGVSSDSAASHQGFADKHRLPYLLATDEDGALRRAFGVPKTLGLLPGRVTYVIDRQGIIRSVFSAQLAADRHVRSALDAIRQLTAASAPKQNR
jgi:thioredoxin-dependent peroxiredoxin